MDVRTLFRRAASFHSDSPAVVFADQHLSFAQCWQRALQLANGLAALGLKPGDHVAVLEDNHLAAVDFLLGTAAGGYVRVPLYAGNGRDAQLHSLRLTECRALVVDEKYADSVAAASEELEHLEIVFVRGDDYETWLSEQCVEDPDPAIDPEDLYYIRFTGGTTGAPKGVPTRHRQFLAQSRDWFYQWPPVCAGDSAYHVAPLAHASGMLFAPVWAAGGRNVIADSRQPTHLLEQMQTHAISYLFLPPTLINALTQVEDADQFNWPHLKVLMSAAAPISESCILRAREVFGDVLYQGYGQSEAFPVAMMGPAEWFAELPDSNPLRAAGKPLPTADVEIWNEECEVLPIGEVGEIAVRCEGQIDSFWRNDQETAERIVRGYMRTGDIGRLDDNGYLYLLDRKNDMIISGGLNIYATEIENAIAEIPGVIEVAVVGIPDDRWGETPYARVRSTDTELTAEIIKAHVGDALGSFKRPGRVEMTTDALPKTVVGKIDRKKIRAPFWTQSDRGVAGA